MKNKEEEVSLQTEKKLLQNEDASEGEKFFSFSSFTQLT
jgi:hypothetical protein